MLIIKYVELNYFCMGKIYFLDKERKLKYYYHMNNQ